MNATKQIMDILTACGASPTATTNENGNTLIKVNAPTIVTTLFDSELEEYEYTKRSDKKC